MQRLPIFEGDHSKHPISQLRHNSPMANAPLGLHLPSNGIGDDSLASFAPDVRSLSQYLFVKVAGGFHDNGDYEPLQAAWQDHCPKIRVRFKTGTKTKRLHTGWSLFQS